MRSQLGRLPVRFQSLTMAEECSPGPGRTDSSANGSPGRPRDVCFSCGKPGHWYRQCMERGSRNPRTPEARSGDGLLSEKRCRCGGGPCLVLTSHTPKNPGRKFYKCPVKTPGMNCQFFEWCDSPSPAASDAIDFSLYPMCACGAGRAKLTFQRDGPCAGKRCFICPIKKGQGACNFLQLADHLMKDKQKSDASGDSSGIVGTGDALPYGKESDKYNGEGLFIDGESSRVVGTGDALPNNGGNLLIHEDASNIVWTVDALAYGKESNMYNGESLPIHGSDRNGTLHVSPSVCLQPAAGTACGKASESPQPTVARKLNFEDVAFVRSPLKSKGGSCYKCGRPGHWVIDCLTHN
ncbi:unnamed protein product [Victoria cruziana]